MDDKLTMHDAHVLDCVSPLEVGPELRLVIAVHPLANSRIVRLSDVQEPIAGRMEVDVQAELASSRWHARRPEAQSGQRNLLSP